MTMSNYLLMLVDKLILSIYVEFIFRADYRLNVFDINTETDSCF